MLDRVMDRSCHLQSRLEHAVKEQNLEPETKKDHIFLRSYGTLSKRHGYLVIGTDRYIVLGMWLWKR